MSEYVILTDSSCDLSEEMVRQAGVQVLPLSFTVNGETYHNYPDNREMDPALFYKKLRDGEVATTAAVNVSQFEECMEPLLQAGKDVLVLTFSSGLSATFQSAKVAADEMAEKYPQRKVYAVDTLCASLGQGLLVVSAAKKKLEGATIDELRDWAEARKRNLCHWFTVDDLGFLKRGGRISAATAVVGTMLKIKPVLHVDNEGHLINMSKSRGRAASLTALVDRMEQSAEHPQTDTVFISHGDCLADAQKVAEDIKARFGNTDVHLNNVGPVIGAHSGPGTVALFFWGKER